MKNIKKLCDTINENVSKLCMITNNSDCSHRSFAEGLVAFEKVENDIAILVCQSEDNLVKIPLVDIKKIIIDIDELDGNVEIDIDITLVNGSINLFLS